MKGSLKFQKPERHLSQTCEPRLINHVQNIWDYSFKLITQASAAGMACFIFSTTIKNLKELFDVTD